MVKFKKTAVLFLIISILVNSIAFAGSDYITRGEVADVLLEAADFYNPDVKRSDILKGYADGSLHEERNVTRAEALVMLERAFGELPEPKGHNKRVGIDAENFDDIPQWAKKELDKVFKSGIVAGTSKGKFSPDDNVTAHQLELFIERAYALYGENPCDDFYAAANKQILENSELNYGQYVDGTLQNVQNEATEHVSEIINEIVNKKHKNGTPEQKMADLYKCFMNTDAINKTSAAPVREYLDEIDSVKNIGELSLVQEKLSENLGVSPFVRFTLTADLQDSTKYMLCFNAFTPFMNKEFYTEKDPEIMKAYKAYLATLLVVSGEKKSFAEENAEKYIAFETTMAESMLSSEKMNSIDQIYNIYKFNKLEALFPDCNLEAELRNKCLTKEEKVLVTDTGLVKKFSEVYNQSNLEVLKISAKIALMDSWGELLDERIGKASENVENAVYGKSGYYQRKQLAEMFLQNMMPEYIGKIYAEKYFDEKSKEDVTNMVIDIKEVFKERIKALEWMSDKTKAKAIEKLDAMRINIGYPDRFDSIIDNVEIVSPEKGGTLFSNVLAVSKVSRTALGSMQFTQRDPGIWAFASYEVNAGYDPTLNTMTFPAAILQSPIYDKEASYERNLGSIGYIIAHEMTHAFDSNGALFDKNGNICNWWTESDYKAFEKLCANVVEFFDGYEPIPAVRENGKLTLMENVADMGAAACITELAGKKENADYREVFYAMANTFVSTSTREYAKFAAQNDPHSDFKTRINCVVVHLDEFYEAFGVKQGDGMYVPPENRIVIW